MVEILKRAPYNVGFGMSLYLQRKEIHPVFEDTEQILRDCVKHGIGEYEVYRISEGLTRELWEEIEDDYQQVQERWRPSYKTFIREFQKVYEKKGDYSHKIIKLLKAVNADNIDQVKKMLNEGKFFKTAGLNTLWGFEDEEGLRLEIEATEQVEYIDTLMMNPIELACVRGFSEIVKYFVEDLNIKQKSELNHRHKELPIDELHFIYVPIL